ncbi:MAG TPA: hypothetical protein VHG28_06650, partial [Longimicrobiaceae bacterium]|nr:hypothetical protein [Longimicrobiaceae bacterium]
MMVEPSISTQPAVAAVGAPGEAQSSSVPLSLAGVYTGTCVHQLFEAQVERTPDATALVHGT